MTKRFAMWMTIVRRLWRPALDAGIALLASSCIEWDQTVASDRPTIANYISTVSTADGNTTAALKSGAPQSASGNPIVTAPIPALVLLGGTIQVTASSATPFTK